MLASTRIIAFHDHIDSTEFAFSFHFDTNIVRMRPPPIIALLISHFPGLGMAQCHTDSRDLILNATLSIVDYTSQMKDTFQASLFNN